MKRITPVEKISKSLEGLYSGMETREDAKSLFIKLAVQKLAQELLEEERTDFLGRGYYERTGAARGLRNGYEPARIKSAEGAMELEAPQVRQTPVQFRSRLLEFISGNTDVLERLAVEMYAKGLSTRDIDEAFQEAGGKRLLSRSSVSAVTERMWEDFKAFQRRDLSGFELECLFLDAVYESLRFRGMSKEGILCAWGILRDGRKVMLHMALGSKESYAAWLDMLRSMVRRGLRVPVSTTSDGAPGVIKAIEEMFPRSLRIHCWFHKMRNVIDKLPAEAAGEVKAHVISVRDAATYELGEARARGVIREFGRRYPSAMECLGSDLEASLNHLKLPVHLRKSARTTNLLERSFEEERRRTKIIPRFFDEKSCLKLVFAVLWRVSGRWQRVQLTAKDLEELDQLRKRLKLKDGKRNNQRLHRVLSAQLAVV